MKSTQSHRRLDALETLEFFLDMDGQHVKCWITKTALARRFGATEENGLLVLLRNLDAIVPVARRVADVTPAGERVVLRSKDFEGATD